MAARPGEEHLWRPPSHSSYLLGHHLQVVTEGPASAFCALAGSVVLDRPVFEDSAAVLLEQVPGARHIRGVLSAAECGQLLLLAEAAGFREEERGGRLVSSFVVDEELNRSLFERVQPWLPQDCLDGRLEGVDRCWVVERVQPGVRGKPALQPAQPRTRLVEHTLARDEACVSYATLALFLSTCAAGGELRFWVPDERLEAFEQPIVEAEQGAGVFFFHGEHPLSSIYEDLPVHGGARHLLKLGVFYENVARKEETEDYKLCVKEHPNIFFGRTKWEQGGWGPILPGMGGPLSQMGASLQHLFALFKDPDAGHGGNMLPPELAGPGGGEVALGKATELAPAVSVGAGSAGGGGSAAEGAALTVGELVEAFWEPEAQYFRARVKGVTADGGVTVAWTDWAGVVTVRSVQVRRVSPEPPPVPAKRVPTEWDTID